MGSFEESVRELMQRKITCSTVELAERLHRKPADIFRRMSGLERFGFVERIGWKKVKGGYTVIWRWIDE